jgi:hypothetical protein
MTKTGILEQLTTDQALAVLKTLSEQNKEYKQKIEQLAREFLKKVDLEEVASDVHNSLIGLDVDDLYGSSGPSRYGYVDPNERSWEMFEEALEPFEEQLKKYHALSMFDEAKLYCKGILTGIYNYEKEGASEFADWVTDAPCENFHRILDDWKKQQKNSSDITEMEKFISKNFPGF